MRSYGRLGFVLMLPVIAIVAPVPSLSQAPKGGDPQVQSQVRAIREEARRIDAAVDNPRESGLTLADKDLGHWDLSGAFKNGTPVYLLARFTEGSLVREESYYFRESQLILARVEKSWDVDNPATAPGPDSKLEFFVQEGRLLRQVTHIGSKPPVTTLGDTKGTPDWLIARSGVITKVLLGSSPGEAIESLNEMPGIEPRRP